MEPAKPKEDLARQDNTPVVLKILGTIQSFRSVSEPLADQFKLHQQLVKVEWAEEKKRLSLMLVISLLGFACFICLLVFVGILVLVLSWNTNFIVMAIILLCAVYGLGAYLAWNRLMLLVKRPEGFFANTRKELAADIDLIKRKLV